MRPPSEQELAEQFRRNQEANKAFRQRGRLDTGPGDGLVLAGWTGHACVFGAHRQSGSVVEIGTPIADGGCVPAPD